MVAALLAVLACGSASAQSVADNLPFESSASGRVYNGTTPLRLWHQTRGYGMEASQTAFGGRLAVDLADAIGFIDGQFRVSNESQFGLDFGGGFRWMAPGLLTGDTRVYGVTGWYDGQETNLNNYFNQLGVSLESLGEQVDFRMNVNIPLENEKSGDIVIDSGEVTYFQNFLSIGTLIPSDVALRIVDFEVAPRIFDLNAWVYAGGYQMDGNDVSDIGAKGGVRGYVTNDLAVDLGVQNDDVFGTNTVFQIIWTPGRTGAGPTSWVHTLADRMREQVYRNTYVATTQVSRAGSSNLTDVDGQDIRVVHVDLTSSAPGDGTFENPYTSINSVNGTGSEQGDIILVHAQKAGDLNVYTGQSVQLKDEQRFLGEGNNVNHQVVTQEMGTIDLPATFAGAITDGVRPTMLNSSGLAAVTLAGITDESEGFAGMEVSNFVIDGGASAIISAGNGVATVNINNLAISDTTGDAIALAAMTQTLENGTTHSRFNVTIDEIEFDDVGGDDIQLTSTTSETTLSQSTTISNIDSENGNGVGINLIEPQRATTVNNFNWDGGSTGLGAIRIFEAGTQGGVVLSNSGAGDNLITGGATGTAYAIKLENSDGAHTVTGTRIEDTGGTSIDVIGGDASMTFTGFIEQSNAQTVLSVTGDHDGTLTFNELTANNGVITATNGNGLQFNGANGAYVFNDLVTLSGTTAVINVNDADDAATFSFLDVDIDYTGTGTAVTVANSDLQTFSISGDIDVTGAGTGRPVSISNNTGGSITFNTTITSSQNGILVTGNDATTVLFAEQVTLNTTTNTAVSLDTNTGGGVTFNDIDITTTSGSGFVADDTDNVVVTGNNNTIAVSAGAGSTVGLSLTDVQVGGAGVAFESVSTTGGTNGIVLDGVTGGAVVIGDANNTAGDGGTIENTSGVGVLIVDAANVTLNGLEVENTGGNGIDISQTTTTASNVTINDTNVTDAAGVGVDITNVANVSMNTMAISGGTGDGINIDHTSTVQSVVRATDVAITNAGGIGIDFNRSATALSRLTLTNVDVDGATDEGITMDIAGSNTVDITIRQGSAVTNIDGNSAVTLTTTGGSKTVNVLFDDSEFSNDSTAATVAIVSNAGTLNTTVTSNTMTNSDIASGQAYTQRVNGGATLLSFDGNTPTNASANNEVELTQAGGTFEVVDLNTIEARNNNAVVDEVGTVTNDPGGTVPQPIP